MSSHTLAKIQEAEEKALKILENAKKKSHTIILQEEEKSHEALRQAKTKAQEKQKEALLAYKSKCAERLEKEEKEVTSQQLAERKKWEANVKKAADGLIQAFQKHFS